MSSDQNSIRNKIKGFWGRINNQEAAPQEEEKTTEMVAEAAAAPAAAAAKPRMLEQTIGEGALLALWIRWAGDKPLKLSLTGNSHDLKLPLEDDRLEREWSRLRLQMERDARKRLQEVCALEEEEAKAFQQDGGNGEPADGGEEAQPKEKKILPGDCKVYLSENRMVAWVMLLPPTDPSAKMPLDIVGKSLQESGVTTGLDSAAVTKLFQEQNYFQLTPIAFGTPAVQGEDGKIIERRPRELQKEVKVDDTGAADYRSLNNIQIVHKGDIICEIVPPKEGVPGIQVDGKVIDVKHGITPKAPSGRNTVLSEDGLQLLAAQDGHLIFSNGTFQVKPVLDIPGDVDYSTGNIDFLGDVHIHGNVRANFSVRASGSLTIDGLVEAAVIESGGDLVIVSGVLGDYKAVIKSKGNIHVKYLENCVAYTAKSIYADCMMLSQVFSDDTIDVTSGRGTIIGGAMTAGHMVKARLLGSQAGRKTKVTLGVLPFVQEELLSNQTELQNVRKEMQELDKELHNLVDQSGLSGNSRLSKAQLRKSVLAMKEMQLIKRIEEVKPSEPDLSKCRLESSTIYPITQIDVGPSRLMVETVENDCRLSYDPQMEEIKLH